jgi:hypothetical protein
VKRTHHLQYTKVNKQQTEKNKLMKAAAYRTEGSQPTTAGFGVKKLLEIIRPKRKKH